MLQHDLVFDVGMHKGEDAAFYLAKGYRVVGFEADPDLVSHCRARFADALRGGRLAIVEGAIARPTGSGTVPFYRNDKNSVFGTISEEFVEINDRLGRTSRRIDVPRIDIGKVFRLHGTPRYIKIDIEGADHLVLEALAALPQKPPYLSVEAEDLEFARLEEQLRTLHALGYRRFAAVQQGTIANSQVTSEDLQGASFEYRFEEGASGVFGEEVEGWTDLDACLLRYRTIVRLHRWFGRKSLMARTRSGRLVRRIARRLIVRGPLPGWYDTHAALE